MESYLVYLIIQNVDIVVIVLLTQKAVDWHFNDAVGSVEHWSVSCSDYSLRHVVLFSLVQAIHNQHIFTSTICTLLFHGLWSRLLVGCKRVAVVYLKGSYHVKFQVFGGFVIKNTSFLATTLEKPHLLLECFTSFCHKSSIANMWCWIQKARQLETSKLLMPKSPISYKTLCYWLRDMISQYFNTFERRPNIHVVWTSISLAKPFFSDCGTRLSKTMPGHLDYIIYAGLHNIFFFGLFSYLLNF